MQLEHLLRAGLLMQSVDVLRDDSAAFALALPFCELEVRGVRLRVERKHFRAVEPVEFCGLAEEKRVAENGLRRILVLLIVQTVYRTEIRDAALGRNACAAEKDDVVAAVDPFLELCDFRSHGKFLLSSRFYLTMLQTPSLRSCGWVSFAM